ncbi:ATP-binding cassette domain-containing protein [Vibrio sp. ZSDE26]|uniref:ATP-binding cassette domain-containing protein n=1 Tax=Vibrio amylolyticus TaxID=2847292 RepID=A0A9X1XJN9_9VIBR|nr:ATP-binding cassette domain-containing protein [Vibrio amylolyticus]MCK6262903.1 ATP-binding cassette domain-containing protein [Vibrio amylolyticus]
MSLCLKNLSIHNRNGDSLFPSLTISIDNGEIVTLMGPSGCGKSTLLDLIAGHLADDFEYSGELSLNDVDISKLEAHKRQVGILFQDDLLFPHLNIWENLAFALPNEVKGKQRKLKAMEALKAISLSKIADSFPQQISGGQRARISLTRMLLAKPKLALLDEPFSKLDKELRSQFRDWVAAELKAANIPALMVTHDKEDMPINGRVLNWPWSGNHA